MKLQRRRGQSLYEYVILLAIVVAVFTGMQIYMKRGIQATIKLGADELGGQKESEELHPLMGRLESFESTRSSSSTETSSISGGTQSTTISATTERTDPEKNKSIYIIRFEPKEVAR